MAEVGDLLFISDRIVALLRSADMQEGALLMGVRKELRDVENAVQEMKDGLVLTHGDPTNRTILDHHLTYLRQLHIRLSVADDLVDDLFTAFTRHRSRNNRWYSSMAKNAVEFFSPSSNPFVVRHKMRDEICKAGKTLTEAITILEAFKLVVEPVKAFPKTNRSASLVARERQSHSFTPHEMVIGRDVEKGEIVDKLLGSVPDESVVVIPIVGVGGVGKTALAQLVFSDKRVQIHFDLCLWVTVGDELGSSNILEKIVASAAYGNVEGLSPEQLQEILNHGILRKRYLFVLDDVRYEETNKTSKWPELKSMLSVGRKGSRIIVTTRSEEVGRNIGSKGQTYKLRPLHEKYAWSLFVKTAFSEHEDELAKPEVAKIGEKILETCGGIPLVIRTIGSILVSKNPETEWQSFYESQLLNTSADESNILPSLKLSYDHLPGVLRRCFAHCMLFPQDYEIDVQTLVNVWISQGLMVSNGELCPEDLGYECFVDLLDRLFIEETERDEWGNVTKCKVQRSFYDLAESIVAKNDFATLHLNGECSDHEGPKQVSLEFHLDSAWQIPTSLPKVKRLRTLILNRQSRWDVQGDSGDSVCDASTKFRFLRILDLHNIGIKVIPRSVAKLRHLRYLDLSRNVNLKKLPKSITSLWNLQTLKLNNCSNLQKFPSNLNELSNLRNLENESCYSLTRMPPGFRQLKNLRTLSEFVLSKGTGSAFEWKISGRFQKRSGKLDELKELNDLNGKLKIKNLRLPEDDKTEEALLKDKEHLLSLALIWDVDATIDATEYEKSLEDLQPPKHLRELSLCAYGGVRFSSWLPSHDSLVKLLLSKCNKCLCLPPLHRLPSLQVLVVDELTELLFISEELAGNGSTEFFPSLKELWLTNLQKLERWWESSGCVTHKAFPCLSKLIIEDCPNLTSMPPFPNLDERLVLKNTKWGPFKETIAWSEASSASSASFNLRTLQIVNMSCDDVTMWRSLQSLRTLTLDCIPEIETLLAGLQQVTSLQELHIWRCDSLKEVSGWIGSIDSLKTLSIRLCPNLTIPSTQISLVTNLQRVEIDNCPRVRHIEGMFKDPLYAS